MELVLTGLHVIVSVFLVLVVLLQRGKRADLAGAFGGGGTQTAFGARQAADLLTKLTTVAAVLFMVTSLGLTIVATRSGGSGGDSVIEDLDATAAELGEEVGEELSEELTGEAPVVPTPAPPAEDNDGGDPPSP